VKIAITGGSGFIGTATRKALESDGHSVFVFDRVDGNDILGELDGLEGADHVVHLAGVLGTDELFDTPYEAIDINIKGTVRVLDWCAANGAGYTGVTLPPVFHSVYTATKMCADRFTQAWHEAYGVPTSTVVAFNVYGEGQKFGPGHPQKFLPTFATRAWMGLPIQIWGDGEQTMDVVSTDDLAKIFSIAVNHGDNDIFDAGVGLEITVNQFAEFVLSVTGSQAGVEYLPMRRGEVPQRIKAEGQGWDKFGDWRPSLDWGHVANVVWSYKDLV
jgi:UDP-glucose 4-epimerase